MTGSQYRRFSLTCSALLFAAPALADSTPPPSPDPLVAGFLDPPIDARPRVWWHWMNGNISEDGIVRDLEWMKRVGIGGAQAFDAAMATPILVDKRLDYMSPEWKQAFRTAARTADRLGLELAIASSPGFTATGGPWVQPQDGMKKIVWSETIISGGQKSGMRLAPPPSITGPFQSIPIDPKGGLLLAGSDRAQPVAPPYYQDIAVLAWPVSAWSMVVPASIRDAEGKAVEAGKLADGDFSTAIELSRPAKGSPALVIDFGKQVSIRSATLHTPGASGRYAGGGLKPVLEASDDAQNWKPVTEFPGASLPATRAFPAVSARYARVLFNKGSGGAAASFVPPVAGLDLAGLGRMMGGSPTLLGPAPGIAVSELSFTAEEKIDRAETKAGFDIAPDYFALPTALPDSPGVPPGQVVDLTSRMRADGSLDWTPPRGTWRVMRLGWSLTGTVNHPASPEATGLEVDKFDGEAVRRYLDQYLGMYREAVGDDLLGQRGLKALLSDSIEAGPANWTGKMREEFRARRGYDPLPWMPALTGTIISSRNASDRFLYDYRQTLSELMSEKHFGTIAETAHRNDMIVYGEAQENGRPQLGDDIAMRRYADIPMAALWTYPRERRPAPAYLVDMRGAASTAHIYGKRIVAAEMMTSLLAPWAFGPSDLRRVADLAFASGINRPVIHTSVHVPIEDRKPGLTLSIFGQYFNRNEAWAELAKPWTDYLARNAFLLQQGRNVADIAWFYGEEAPLTGMYSDKLVPNAPKEFAYDFVNAAALAESLSNDGADLVTPGGARYRALYLGGSSERMTLSTLRRIAQLVDGGATVIGHRPLSNPGLGGDATEYEALRSKLWPGGVSASIGKGRVIVSADPAAALKGQGIIPAFVAQGASPDAEILFVNRRLDSGESWFLSNRRNRAETFEARFRMTGMVPELWHAESGEIEQVSYRMDEGTTIVPLTLPPEGSVHIVFRRAASLSSLTYAKPEQKLAGELDNDWLVEFQPGRGAPPSIRLASLSPLDQNGDSGVRHFSGIATYTRQFQSPKGWKPGRPLWLDLGEAREIAEVSVNGNLAGGVWTAPYRIDIGKFAKRGRNALSIRVANLWVNRMIGDAQPGAEKIAWTPSITYTAKAPLRRSGLIGPVKLFTVLPKAVQLVKEAPVSSSDKRHNVSPASSSSAPLP